MLKLTDDQQYVVGVGRVLAEAQPESLEPTELLLIIAKQSFYIDELEQKLSKREGAQKEEMAAKAP
ncbi:MAG: hypothetical protein IT327_02510 [Anaerolineae bacterium]|jgi:hypothetical protein|nr:hypothetical protein [Anaerolineae bacterium]